nr:hypothetical protein [Thermoanaerobaculia bacterium]
MNELRFALRRLARRPVMAGAAVACLAIGIGAVTAVASLAAAPTGDSMENLTHAHPPAPRWSRDSQRWALERIVHSHHSIDDAFVDACVSAAAGAPHRAACEW